MGKKQTVGYRYYMGLHFGICHGPVDKFLRIIAGGREAWVGTKTANGDFTVNAPTLFGGEEREGGLDGTATLLLGGSAQTLPANVTAQLPVQTPAFRGIFSLFYDGMISCNNPYIKPLGFQVQRITAGWSGGTAWYAAKAVVGGVPAADSYPVTAWGTVSRTYTSMAYPQGANSVLMFENQNSTTSHVYELLPDGSKTFLRTISRPASAASANGTSDTEGMFFSGEYPGHDYSYWISPLGVVTATYHAVLNANNYKCVARRGNYVAVAVADDDRMALWSATGGEPLATKWTGGGTWGHYSLAFGKYVYAGAERDVLYAMRNDGRVSVKLCEPVSPLARLAEVELLPAFPFSSATNQEIVTDEQGNLFQLGTDNVNRHELYRYIDGAWELVALLGLARPYGMPQVANGVQVIGNTFWIWRQSTTAQSATDTSVYRVDFSKVPAFGYMNPAHIIYQCLTDPSWGMGYPTASMGTTFTGAADTLYSEGFGLCLLWNRQDEIGAFIKQVLDHIGAALYIDPQTGKFELKLFRADYSPGALEVFDESKIKSLDQFQRVGYGDTVNEITVIYRDANTNKDTPITVQNLANIQAQGGVVSATRQYPGIPNDSLAARVAERDLIAASTPLAKGRMTVNRTAWSLFPGGVFKLTWAKLGLSAVICRVLGVDYGELHDGEIVVDFAEDVFGLPTTSYSAQQPAGWVAPTTAPQAITKQVIVEAPYWSLVKQMTPADLASLDAASAYFAALASRPAGTPQSFIVNSRTGSAAYLNVGTGAFVPSATLNGAITRTTTTIPIANGIDLDLVELNTLAVIGKGRYAEWVEILAVDTGTTPTITVARGVLDTTPQTHASGTLILFDDGGSASDPTERATNEVVDFKLQTVATGGTLLLDLVVPVSETAAQRQYRAYPPGKLRFNSVAYPTTVYGQFTLGWVHRDRLQQTAYIVDQDEASIGPEAGTTYSIECRNNDTQALLYSVTGLSGVSQVIPSIEVTRCNLKVGVWSVRNGVASWHVNEHVVDYFGTTVYTVTVSKIMGTAVGGFGATATGKTFAVTTSLNPIGAAGIGSDPLWAKVTLLLRGETGDGDTTPQDDTPLNHTVTGANGAQVSTTQAKFGSGSLRINTSDDTMIVTRQGVEFDFGSGDFCVEADVWTTSAVALQSLLTNRASSGSDPGFQLYLGSDGKVKAAAYGPSAGSVLFSIGGTTTYPTSTWFHVALERVGSTVTLYLNGAVEATAAVSTTAIAASTYNLCLGYDPSAGGRVLVGYLDEVRITKGSNRYNGTAFTPHTASWPTNGGIIAAGATITATSSLIPGTAVDGANGVTVEAVVSLIAGSASGT